MKIAIDELDSYKQLAPKLGMNKLFKQYKLADNDNFFYYVIYTDIFSNENSRMAIQRVLFLIDEFFMDGIIDEKIIKLLLVMHNILIQSDNKITGTNCVIFKDIIINKNLRKLATFSMKIEENEQDKILSLFKTICFDKDIKLENEQKRNMKLFFKGIGCSDESIDEKFKNYLVGLDGKMEEKIDDNKLMEIAVNLSSDENVSKEAIFKNIINDIIELDLCLQKREIQSNQNLSSVGINNEDEINSLNRKIEDLEKELVNEREHKKQIQDELNEEIIGELNKINNLNLDIETLKAELINEKKSKEQIQDKLNQEIIEEINKINKLNFEVQTLKKELADKKISDNQYEMDLNEEKKKNNIEIQSLKDELNKQKLINEDLNDINKDKEIIKYKEEINTLNKEVIEEINKVSYLMNQIKCLREELEEEKNTVKNLKMSHPENQAKLNREVKKLQTQLDDEKLIKEQLKVNFNKKEEELKEKNKIINELIQSNQSIAILKDSLSSELRLLKNKFNKTMNTFSLKKTKISLLQSILDSVFTKLKDNGIDI